MHLSGNNTEVVLLSTKCVEEDYRLNTSLEEKPKRKSEKKILHK
jgi:hypothetical protein